MSSTIEIYTVLPVLPLRERVVFPNTIYPLMVGRERSVAALQESLMMDKQLLLLTQKDPMKEAVKSSDLYRFGTVASIEQVIRLPKGGIKVLVEGIVRAKVLRFRNREDFLEARLSLIERSGSPGGAEMEALSRKAKELFDEYLSLRQEIPAEVHYTISREKDRQRVADLISTYLETGTKNQQKLLEAKDLYEQFQMLLIFLRQEIEVAKMEREIDSRLKDGLESSQREFILEQKLREIQKELGRGANEPPYIAEYEKKLSNPRYPEPVREKVKEELVRLKLMHPTSAEADVSRTYIETLLDLPWGIYSKDILDIEAARELLEKSHYGLADVKERLIENIAVMKLSGKVSGSILTLVGPPGVGKTSLGRAVAGVLGRRFVRISLGGISDEAEIRGHRRTYVGALPGKIISMMKQAGTMNPVMLLDEVDKLTKSIQGDPASALLEVLDPEQNKEFVDNYIATEFDLSSVLFITTANTIAGIPPSLLDRMELLRLPGYSDYEKLNIAKRFLVPKSRKKAGLSDYNIRFTDGAINCIIREYTREAGVRELERKIDSVMRKIAKQIVSGKSFPDRFSITTRMVKQYLGPPPYREDDLKRPLIPGEALGLAWTPVGGEVLTVETAIVDGKKPLLLTGSLGDVMKESAQAALSYIKSKGKEFELPLEKLDGKTLHIHLPEGAIPKDGPSAGVAIVSAIFSLLRNLPNPSSLAMTGEITLSGRVLTVGGIPEKLLAARRYGIKNVVVPEGNQPDVEKMEKKVLKGVNIHYVKSMEEIIALLRGEK